MSKEKRGEKRMKEEDTLLKKLGKENSFKVPEALYGSYVYRCGSYYTGGIDRP